MDTAFGTIIIGLEFIYLSQLCPEVGVSRKERVGGRVEREEKRGREGGAEARDGKGNLW